MLQVAALHLCTPEACDVSYVVCGWKHRLELSFYRRKPDLLKLASFLNQLFIKNFQGNST